MEQLAARRAHNPKVGGSSPPPATKTKGRDWKISSFRFNILEDGPRTVGSDFFRSEGRAYVCGLPSDDRKRTSIVLSILLPLPQRTSRKICPLFCFVIVLKMHLDFERAG